MLQYITQTGVDRTVERQVEEAIQGGCRWIELSIDNVDAGDRREAMRLHAESIIPLCRGVDAFLILNNEPDLALELECHGVQLSRGGMSPREAREKLGAGAIIGVEVGTPEEALALRGLDIDYATVCDASPEKVKPIVDAVREVGFQLPVVAAGATRETMAALCEAGAAGLCVGRAAATAPDMTLYIASMLKELEDR